MPRRTQQQAQQELGGYAQSRYGQTPDWQQMAGALGYTGGDVDDDLFNRGQSWIDQTFGSASAPPPVAPPPGVELQVPGPGGAAPPPEPTPPPAPPPPPGVEMAPSPPQIPTPPGVGFAPSPPQLPTGFIPGVPGSGPPPPGTVAMQTGGPGGAAPEDILPPSPVPAPSPAPSPSPVPTAGPPAPPSGGAPPPPPPTLSGAPPPPAGAPPAPPAPTRSPLQTAAQEALLRMLASLEDTPSLDDPTLRPASEAFRLAQERGIGRKRNAMAERMAAQGTATSGGLDAQVLGIESDAADQIGAHDAGLLLQEGQLRRDKLAQAIGMAEAAGEFEQAQNLQRELATLDAGLRQQALDLQGRGLDISEMLGRGNLDVARGDLALRGELGRGDLALRGELGRGDLDLRRLLGTGELDLQRGDLDLRRLLGTGQLNLQNRGLDLNTELGRGDLNLRNRGLTQAGQLGRLDALMRMFGMSLQNDQFNTRQGFDWTQLQHLMNRDWMTQLLQGL